MNRNDYMREYMRKYRATPDGRAKDEKARYRYALKYVLRYLKNHREQIDHPELDAFINVASSIIK